MLLFACSVHIRKYHHPPIHCIPLKEESRACVNLAVCLIIYNVPVRGAAPRVVSQKLYAVFCLSLALLEGNNINFHIDIFESSLCPCWEAPVGPIWGHVESGVSPKKWPSKEGRGRHEVLVFLCCSWVLSREQAACPASCRKSAAELGN